MTTAWRKCVRLVVQARFGHVAPEVEAVIAATEDEDDLDALLDLAATVRTEDELTG